MKDNFHFYCRFIVTFAAWSVLQSITSSLLVPYNNAATAVHYKCTDIHCSRLLPFRRFDDKMAKDELRTARHTAAKKSGSHALQDGIKKLLISEKYSDLTVSCGVRSWKVHKAVVCTQSEFFASACDRGFKVQIAPLS